jgi:hypothetical protein
MSAEPTMLQFQFEGEVWFYTNPNAVYFVSLPQDISSDIMELVGLSLNPWGTVPVTAMIGDFTWSSSMFPRPDRNCYDLPLNAKIRKRLGIADGDHLAVTIRIPITI